MDIIELKELLKSIGGDAFSYHSEFVKEFIELTDKTGSQKAIVKAFLERLAMIVELGNIDFGLNWLEHLKEYGNLYSLHIKADKKNYRLLFSKNKKGKLFLHMFYEKGGKKETSYSKHAPIAIKRRDEDSKGEK